MLTLLPSDRRLRGVVPGTHLELRAFRPWLHEQMHAPLHVAVLGPLQVRLDGAEATPRGQRLRDVLAVLVQRRGRPVAADTLLDLVWGDRAGEVGVSAVHTVVSRLRRRLGHSAVIADEVGYLVDRGLPTDQDTFDELLADARRFLEQGDAHAACSSYRDAVALWRGSDAFADISPELVSADRARLAEQRAVAIEEWAAALVDLPDSGPAQAWSVAAGLVDEQPLRERPYQLAMVAAYRCHRQAEALALYGNLRLRLRTELGIEPAPETARLQAMILRHDPALAVRAEALPWPSVPRVESSFLPAPVNPLIGRQDELARTLNALTDGRRLITLVGPGGVGKSRLLVEVGARLGSQKEVSYQALSGLDEPGPTELAATLALELGLLDPRIPPVDALIGALADGNRLLLIDEAELVAPSLAILVRAVLEACPGVQILLTSRVPLDVTGELVISVNPLDCPEADADHEVIVSSAAVQFLAGKLTDRAIVWDQTPSTARFLALIARSADGLPLVLEIAAGQASGRSPAEVAELIRSPLDLPATERIPTVRHRSLRDALAGSVDGLDPLRRTVLRRLSVFAGQFDLAAAGAVVGLREPDAPMTTVPIGHAGATDTAEAVRSLARDSLVHIERSGPTRLSYRLLRPVRDLAAEGFDRDELAATRARHRRWYARMSTAPRDDIVWGVRTHLDDCLSALDNAVAVGDVDAVTDLAVVLADFWRQNGGQEIGLRSTTRVLDSGLLRGAHRGRVLAHRAALALHHVPDSALADSGAAIEALAGSTTHRSDLVLAQTVRSIELYARGRWQPALEQIDGAVAAARAGADEPLLAAVSIQAMVLSAIGDIAGATAALRESRALINTVSSRSARVAALTNLAFALLNLQRPRDAQLALDEVAIELEPTIGQRPPDFALLCSGWAALAAAEPTPALTWFVRADRLQAQGIADRQSAEMYLGAACALSALDDPAAADLLAAAIELTARVQLVLPPPFAVVLNTALGKVEKRSGPDLSTVPITVLLDRLAGLLDAAVARKS